MLILSCDTSGPVLSAALWRDGRILAESLLQVARPHSTTLLPLVESLLQQSKVTIEQVDAFACAVGPGSFTGIRIGVSTFKAMAYAAGRPAIGISTLEAMSWPYVACSGQVVCPILDARNQRIFASAWSGGQEVIGEANWQSADFLAAVRTLVEERAAEDPKQSMHILLTGHWPTLLNQPEYVEFAKNIGLSPTCASFPRAAAIAEIAERRLDGSAKGEPQQLMPRYLSLSQAERQKAARHD